MTLGDPRLDQEVSLDGASFDTCRAGPEKGLA